MTVAGTGFSVSTALSSLVFDTNHDHELHERFPDDGHDRGVQLYVQGPERDVGDDGHGDGRGRSDRDRYVHGDHAGDHRDARAGSDRRDGDGGRNGLLGVDGADIVGLRYRVTIASCTSGSLTTGATGAFSCTFTVPSGVSGTTVTATDVGGQTASGTFTVTTPAITVTPAQGPIGATVTVAGTGFSVSTALTSLVFDTKTITAASCTSGSLTTGATGAFSCTFVVPAGVSGTTVTATDVGGQTATGTFTVTTPAITVTPGQGPIGATVTVAGTGFSVSTALSSLVFDSVTITSCTSGSLTTDGTGSFSCTFAVPTGVSGATVTATDVGGQTATGTFTVTTPAITVTPGAGSDRRDGDGGRARASQCRRRCRRWYSIRSRSRAARAVP